MNIIFVEKFLSTKTEFLLGFIFGKHLRFQFLYVFAFLSCLDGVGMIRWNTRLH